MLSSPFPVTHAGSELQGLTLHCAGSPDPTVSPRHLRCVPSMWTACFPTRVAVYVGRNCISVENLQAPPFWGNLYLGAHVSPPAVLQFRYGSTGHCFNPAPSSLPQPGLLRLLLQLKGAACPLSEPPFCLSVVLSSLCLSAFRLPPFQGCPVSGTLDKGLRG